MNPKNLMADLKSTHVGMGLFPLGFNLGDPSRGRSLVTASNQFFEADGESLRYDLHIPLGGISHPTGKTQLLGRLLSPGPKENPLDPAPNQGVKPAFSCHCH
jgi:hypothetical protein